MGFNHSIYPEIPTGKRTAFFMFAKDGEKKNLMMI